MNNHGWIQMRRPIAAMSLLFALGIGGAAGSWLGGHRDPRGVNLLVSGAGGPVGDQVSFSTGLTPVVERVLPSVVNVSSAKIVRFSDSGPTSPFFYDPFFDEFFGGEDPGRGRPREQREESLGSGVVVSPDGYLLTNNHVVEDATEIRVSFADKREMKTKIIGTDPHTDVAVIKVDAKDLPAITLRDSASVKAGEFVLAIGNPFGLGQSVSLGIVSATGRGNLSIADYEDFIQTDAAINPGNSGGALVDIHGALIGINTAILSRSGGNQGIGFAVPTNMARQVMEKIVKEGRVVRGWLGVSAQPITPAMARALGLEKPEGALLADVAPGSPAEKAGLRRGDIVLSVNGEPINETHELSLKIAMLAPGTKVRLNIIRKGREMEIPVVLGERPQETRVSDRRAEPRATRVLEGVEVQDLTPDIRQQLGLSPGTAGVVVAGVEPGSPAAEAGLERGDVIQEVNGEAISSVSQFEQAVRKGAGKPVMLLVNRGGSTLYIAVEPR